MSSIEIIAWINSLGQSDFLKNVALGAEGNDPKQIPFSDILKLQPKTVTMTAGEYVLTNDDEGKLLITEEQGDFKIPSGIFPDNGAVGFVRKTVDPVSIVAEAGVTLNSNGSNNNLARENSSAFAGKLSTDNWLMNGQFEVELEFADVNGNPNENFSAKLPSAPEHVVRRDGSDINGATIKDSSVGGPNPGQLLGSQVRVNTGQLTQWTGWSTGVQGDEAKSWEATIGFRGVCRVWITAHWEGGDSADHIWGEWIVFKNENVLSVANVPNTSSTRFGSLSLATTGGKLTIDKSAGTSASTFVVSIITMGAAQQVASV